VALTNGNVQIQSHGLDLAQSSNDQKRRRNKNIS